MLGDVTKINKGGGGQSGKEEKDLCNPHFFDAKFVKGFVSLRCCFCCSCYIRMEAK
jgi:hypothetical protein